MQNHYVEIQRGAFSGEPLILDLTVNAQPPATFDWYINGAHISTLQQQHNIVHSTHAENR